MRFNDQREQERLGLKYRAMRSSVFAFFRGSAHLFWEDLARDDAFTTSPRVWSCGDLHLENFGSFRGDNGLVYFDVNDFDEGALAPATWDVARFVSSIFVAASSLRLDAAEASGLANIFLSSYQTALVDGKARWLERSTATGMVRTLLRQIKHRTSAMLLDNRTVLDGDRRHIRTDGSRALPATEEQRTQLDEWLKHFAASQPNPKFFKVLDVARRVAGMGSLGVPRFILLIRGDGSPDGNVLLDAKEARPSCLGSFARVAQPAWPNEATRVVQLQHRMQAIAPAFLRAVTMGSSSFVVRELQPSEDRLTLTDARGHSRRLRMVMQTMGHATAWAQLRSAGRDGSAIADELIAFGRQTGWRRTLLDFGRRYRHQVERDYKQFVVAHEDGALS
jgi:uncharacterized protein (DUF2252 family)